LIDKWLEANHTTTLRTRSHYHTMCFF